MTSINHQDFGSDSEDDDFNPPPQIDSDEDAVRAPKRQANSNGREGVKQRQAPPSDAEDDEDEPNGNRGDDDEDDEENEDEDDEDEDDEDDDGEAEDDEVRPHKRRRRIIGNQFIDREAEVTEDEDEDEGDEDEDIGEEVHPEDLSRVVGEHDDRKHRLLDRKRQQEEDLDAEEQAEVLRQKYGRQRMATTEVSTVPQHLLLPSVKDPSIYAVKCKPGKEQEVVLSILKRIAETLDGSLAGVTSVFAREKAMSGYIYVEAERKPDVAKATEEVIFCYASQMTLIPLNEMPDLLRVKKPKDIKEGSFVRMRRPAKYAGDLAQVESVDLNNSEVTVKLIPRLEFGDEDNGAAATKRKRPGGVPYRPPQRLFNEHEVRKRAMGRLQPGGARDVFIYQNEEYEKGFLIKTVKTNYIDTENVNPTLEEATKFSATGEDGEELDLTALAASLRQTVSSGDYIPGDMVEIYQGEQQGLRGKTLTVHSDILSLEVSDGPLKGEKIDAPIKTLRKLFTEGDNVKVLSGSKYNGESGMVLAVQGDFVTILTDSNNEQIKVFSKDLRVAVDSGASVGNSKYALFDLVLLDATRVACVIKIDRETVRVLDQDGNVRTVLPSSISAKLDKKRQTVATDRNGTQIQVEDAIREHAGNQRRGEIIGIHRNYLFVKDRLIHQNLGVWATKSSNVEISSAKGGRPTGNGIDISRMNPNLMQSAASMLPPQPVKNFGGRDRLEGKIVLVSKGDYKGMVGRVKSVTATSVSVELEARSSKFPTSFPKDILKVKDEASGQFYPIGQQGRRVPGGGMSQNSSSGSGFSSSLPSRTPMGSRTPMAASGGRTPAWGMGDGNRTPAWGMGASRGTTTSSYSSGGGFGDGGRTPAWGQSSSRTPAWQPDYGGSRTVMHQSDGNRTAYGGQDYASGGKTPAYYGNSAPTPGASGTAAYSSRQPAYPKTAPTPGAMDAPTPGAYLGAPTPGAYDAPTPKPFAYGTPAASAPTPGAAYAETPGAYAAETPAAFGGDDDDDDVPGYD